MAGLATQNVCFTTNPDPPTLAAPDGRHHHGFRLGEASRPSLSSQQERELGTAQTSASHSQPSLASVSHMLTSMSQHYSSVSTGVSDQLLY